MPQVFVSYAHVNPDQDLATKLSRSLETNGFSVFIDAKIGLGQNWVDQIDVQLRNSTHFIALLSAASIKSDMVRREIAMAYKLRKANKLTILPVRLDLDDELPYELGAYLDLIQYIVWRPGESFDPICGAILSAVRGSSSHSVLPQPAPPPPSPPTDKPGKPPYDYMLYSPLNPNRVPWMKPPWEEPGEKAAAPPAPATPALQPASDPQRFPESQLERVKSELAHHLGPVARVVVDRAAKKAANWEQLYDLLSAEIPAGEERRRFQATRPR